MVKDGGLGSGGYNQRLIINTVFDIVRKALSSLYSRAVSCTIRDLAISGKTRQRRKEGVN